MHVPRFHFQSKLNSIDSEQLLYAIYSSSVLFFRRFRVFLVVWKNAFGRYGKNYPRFFDPDGKEFLIKNIFFLGFLEQFAASEKKCSSPFWQKIWFWNLMGVGTSKNSHQNSHPLIMQILGISECFCEKIFRPFWRKSSVPDSPNTSRGFEIFVIFWISSLWIRTTISSGLFSALPKMGNATFFLRGDNFH